MQHLKTHIHSNNTSLLIDSINKNTPKKANNNQYPTTYKYYIINKSAKRSNKSK